jgi:hypothetical protein
MKFSNIKKSNFFILLISDSVRKMNYSSTIYGMLLMKMTAATCFSALINNTVTQY